MLICKKNSFKPYFIVYAIALLLSVSTGTILKLFCTDPTTGFVNTGGFTGSFAVLILYRLSLVLPILFWFLLNAKRRAKQDYPLSYRHKLSGVLAALTGLCIIVYSIKEVPYQIISEKLLDEQPSAYVVESLSSRALILVVIVFGVLAGLSLIMSVSIPKYLTASKRGGLFGFIAALWQITVLFARFNNFIAVTTINDILMILLFMCFAAMFLIGQARVTFGLGIRSGKTYAVPAGLSVSLIGFSFAIPSVINYFLNGKLTYVINTGIAELCYIIALSLYAVVFIGAFTRAIKTV